MVIFIEKKTYENRNSQSQKVTKLKSKHQHIKILQNCFWKGTIAVPIRFTINLNNLEDEREESCQMIFYADDSNMARLNAEYELNFEMEMNDLRPTKRSAMEKRHFKTLQT